MNPYSYLFHLCSVIFNLKCKILAISKEIAISKIIELPFLKVGILLNISSHISHTIKIQLIFILRLFPSNAGIVNKHFPQNPALCATKGCTRAKNHSLAIFAENRLLKVFIGNVMKVNALVMRNVRMTPMKKLALNWMFYAKGNL